MTTKENITLTTFVDRYAVSSVLESVNSICKSWHQETACVRCAHILKDEAGTVEVPLKSNPYLPELQFSQW